jgi:predicted phosphodiesterase
MARIAIVSDIHGNRTAFEAVLKDLRETAPDMILHGGDLADAGAGPVEIVDRIRDLGWQGVVGNTDEMLFRPESLNEFAEQSPGLRSLFATIAEMAAATREALGEERLAWLRGLPTVQICPPMALVHASPASAWRSPPHTADDGELEQVYGSMGQPIVVYGHIHIGYVRRVSGMTIVNTGSIGMPYDGDRRASYLLLDESEPVIRRVEYDVDKEIGILAGCGLPHAGWVVKILAGASPRMP